MYNNNYERMLVSICKCMLLLQHVCLFTLQRIIAHGLLFVNFINVSAHMYLLTTYTITHVIYLKQGGTKFCTEAGTN